ncbi:MAG: TrkA family potassium uptake protein [bacterium]
MKFAVVGLGLFGKKLARELAEQDHEVLAIDRDEEPVTAVQDDVSKAVIGDVTQEGLLDELVTEEFDAVIVTMATDLEASLLSVLHAKEIGVKDILAKSNGPKHTTILKRLGIQNIISPEEDVAEQLAEKIGNPKVHEYMQFQNGHSIAEMKVPDEFVGQTLRELNLRDEHGIQVIGIQRAGSGEIDYVPSPSVPFEDEDVIWVTGPEDVLKDFSR